MTPFLEDTLMYEKRGRGVCGGAVVKSESASPLVEPYSQPNIPSTLRSIFSSIPLIRVLVRRDLRLRYHSSVLGYLWTLIEPLLLAAAYYFVFIILRGTTEEMYPLLVLTGVLIWSMFTKTVRFSVNSLVKNAGLIQQIQFPHATLIISKCGANYIITMLSMLVLIPFMMLYDLGITWRIVYVLYGLLMSGVLAAAVGFLLAPANVRYRDIDHLIGFVTRIGFFLTPIMYTIDYIPGEHRWWYLFGNPMAVNISTVRSGILGKPLAIETTSILASAASTLFLLWIGLWVYSRFQNKAVKYL
jgi:ABC-type polysaccharide/polyol phosphate export permease